MPFHFCTDELLAIMAMIPFIGFIFAKMHVWWHKHFNHHCHKDSQCTELHAEHPTHDEYDPFARCSIEPISAEDAKYLSGNIVHDVGPEPEDGFVWDWISADDVEGRFGGSIMDDLIGDHTLLHVSERPLDDEFTWYVNDVNHEELMAQFRGRLFYVEDNEWKEIPKR
jgi:hypothetical protein